MSIWCAVCNDLKPCDEAVQRLSTVQAVPTSGGFFVIPDDTSAKGRIRYSQYGALQTRSLRTVMDAAAEKMTCPAFSCNESMVDEDDANCEGLCKQVLTYDKTVVLPCCGAKMCDECAQKWTGGRDFCDPGKCIIKDTTKKKKAPETTRQPCQGSPGCEGEVLRNFPSEFECEHDMCISCLSTMLDECEKSGKAPICPSKTCGLPYRVESVSALAAQFAERKNYFSKFTLQAKFSMQTLRDSSVSNVLHGNPTTVMGQKFVLKIGQCEEEDGTMTMEYVREGSLGDLIREVRRVLKILATDKIYGYHRIDDGKKTKLEVTQKTIRLSCASLSINEVV
uniref:RING-type domain-containing protein n=1 Tax=Caenorhabditis japonica TaxID=281687 RepID=A0A8R1HQY3_CAEJA